MEPARPGVTGYRTALAVATVASLYFATIEHPGPVVAATNDKLQHVLAFGAMALLLDFSFPRGRFGVAKVAALVGFGVLIEFIQYFLPWREASLLDLCADCVGIAAYGLGMPLLDRVPVLSRLARERHRLAQA